ncbi:hypothetical protein Tco_1525722 [Tanacetum coccineum]
MESVKKLIDERALHKRECGSRVNERQMQTKEGKVDTSKGLDASLAVTESSGTDSRKQDTSSKSRNDIDADDADIKPIYDEELLAKVDQDAKQCHDKRLLTTSLTNSKTTKLSNQFLESENSRLKKTVAQYQHDFSKLEAHCINLELQLQNNFLKPGKHGQFLKAKSNESKVQNDIDVIETINIELEQKVAKLLKENEHLKAQIQDKVFATASLKNELRKLRGNSVDTKFAKPLILGKPLLHPLRNQSVVRQPNAFKSERPKISKSRNSSKSISTSTLKVTYGSNDMIHNYYLEDARKKTQESGRNSRPTMMPSAISQSTTNSTKPKPRINNQNSRNWLASKSSCVTTKTVPIAEHSRNSRNFSDSKHFVCSTCQKCVFNANLDSCVTKFLNEVNSRAKVPSHKTTNRNKPVEQISIAKKPERQITTGHRFSIKKTSIVHEKTMTPRSCLRYYMQCSKGRSQSLVAEKTVMAETRDSRNSDMIWKVYSVLCSTNNSNGENQVVSKSSAVTTADAFDKRQQQPDSTSSTSTLATTVTADGNFNLCIFLFFSLF